MADYYINSDRGKELANSLRAGDMAEASDGSLWRKEADGSISVIKNGQTMTGRVGVSAPAVSAAPETPSLSPAPTVETPALDAARQSDPAYSLQQKAAAQEQQVLASEKAKQAAEAVTSGLTQEPISDDLLAQAIQQASKPESYTIGSAKGVLMTDRMQKAGDMAEASDGSLWKRNEDGSISVTKNGKTYTANVDRAAAKQDPQWAVLTAPPVEEEEESGKKSKKKSSGTSSGSGSSGSLNTYFSGASTGAKKETTQAASGSTGGDIASLRKKAASAQKDMGDIARQIAAKKAQGKTDTAALEAKYAEAKGRYDSAMSQINGGEATLVRRATAPEVKASAASGVTAREAYDTVLAPAPERASVLREYQSRTEARQAEEATARAAQTEGPTLLEAATRAPEKQEAVRKAVQRESWRGLPTVADADRFSVNKVSDAAARKEAQKNAWRSLPTVQDSERFSIPSQTDSLMQQAIAQAPRTLSGKPYLPENDGGFSHSSGTSKSVKDRLAAQQMNIAMANDDYDTIRRIREQNNYLDDNESFKYLAGRAKTGLLGAIQGVGNALSYLFQVKEPEGYDWDNPVMTGEQFAESVSGLKRTFSFADTDAQKFAQRYAGRNIPAAQRTAGSVAEGVAGMIPTIASNIAVPGSSLYVLFTQAAGSATTDALQRGASGQNAVAYGVANGALEVLTEKMFDGVAGVFGKGAADDALQSLVRRVTQNEGAQNALLTIADSLGEGFEEFVSEFGDKVLADLLLKDDDRSFRTVLSDAGDSFLVGALTSAVMQAAGSITKNTTPKQAAEKVNDILQEDIRQESINANVREAAQQSALDRGMLETMRPEAFHTPAWAELLNTQQTTQATAERGAGDVITGGEVNKNASTYAEAESTSVNDNPAVHTPQEQAVIEAYKNSTDESLKETFQSYLENPRQGFSRHNINDVSERQAADASKILGGDYTGYKNAINSNGINHILNEHGPFGEVNQSMADLNDPARVGYVLRNYDTVERATYSSGDADMSAEFRDANNNPAPMLKYSKKVNGTYYVVEAIPESKYKKFWVVSAYMEAGGGTQAPNAVRPGNTSGTSLASSPSAGFSVPQPGNSVNQNISPNDMGAMRSQFESVPKQSQTQSNTINSMEAEWNVPEAQRALTQDELLDYAIQAASRGEILTSPPQRMSESSGQNVRTINQMGTNNAYASAEENAAARSYTHEQVSNAEQFARANGRVLTDSDGNVSNYTGQVQELLAADHWNNTDRDVAATLRHEAFQRGDMDSFYRLSDRITETNTEAGRTLQGTQKWLEQAHPEQAVVAAAKKALDTNPKAPSGKMAFIEKTARKISGFGDNVSQWAGALKQIAEERRMTGVDMLVRMAEKQGANDPQWLKSLVYNGLYNVAGDYEKPTGAVDSVNKGLRRLKSYVITNQLFRVTTNAANVVSNSISNATEAAAANTGTAHLADAIMGKFTGLRSHGTFENVLGKEALATGKNLAQKSFVEIWLDTSTEGTDSKFQSSKGRAVREYKMTGNQLFSTIDAVLSTALNTTDAFATGVSQGAAQAALRRNVQKGYLTAEQALDVAEQRGSDTTFHNKTALGTTLQRVQAAMNGGLEYGAGNIVAGNYLNVPAAVLMREVSKMPTVGTVGALIDMAAVCIDGKTGKNTIGDLQAKITGEKLTLAQRQSRAAQQLGRSLALGTMEVAGYTALALKGIIRRIDDDDKDKAAFEAAGGQQGLYINWSALWRSVPGGDSEWQDGDVITNLGRLEPLTVNMNFGIDVAEALKTDEGLRTEDLKNISISAVQDGIADLSMIQNIQGIMNALQYRSEDQSAFQAVGQELLASNVASLTPGLIQQAAKAIDPYYRDLYTGDTSGQQIYDIWANTIPGLRQQLPEKLTGFGTPKEYAGTDAERAANAFLNPYATTTVRSKTGLETMLQDAEDVSVYPNRNPIGSVSIDGQTVTLTNGQKRQYQTVYGQTYRDTLYALQGSSAFQQLDRQTKDAVMKAAESYAGVSAKNALDIGYKPPEGYAERAEMDSTALADALILEAVKSQKYLSPETQTAKSAVESQYSSADYARQSLDLVESAKEKAASYFEHAEQAKYGGELNEAEQELVGKDSEYIADYFMRKAIDGYKNADGTTGHLSGENAVKYNAVAKSFDTPLFSAVTDDLLVQAKKKAHAFYTEVEKTDFGSVMSADNRALNRKFAKMDNDEIAQYFLSVAAKEKFKDTNGNGTNLDEAAAALKSGDITDPTVFAFLDSDVVEDYTRYGKGSSITPEILLHAARAKKTVKQDTDQDGVVVNSSQEQFEDWVNRQSWTQTQKQDVMKVFYPNTAEKKNYLVESLNSGKMKYTDAKKELTPTLQAGWTHQLLPTLAENANDTTKGVLMSQYIEAAAAYDDRPNASERKALNYSYAWQWFCDYLNTTDMTREQKYQVALIMSGTDSQKTKDKIWSRLK